MCLYIHGLYLVILLFNMMGTVTDLMNLSLRKVLDTLERRQTDRQTDRQTEGKKEYM